MNTGYLMKAVCRDKMNIKAFVNCFGVGVGRTFFFTMTFADNVTEKKEASSMWNNLSTTIGRNFGKFEYVMVWERQKRGAWHLHLLGTVPALRSLNQLNRFLDNFSIMSSKSYGFRRLRWTYGDSAKLVSYLCKYLTKEAGSREKGVRYVSYTRGWLRMCCMPFSFVGGKSAEWRKNCASLHEELGTFFSCFYKSARFDWVRDAVLTRSASLVRQWVSKNEILGRLLAVKDEMNTPAYKEETLYREVLKLHNKRERFLNYEFNC